MPLINIICRRASTGAQSYLQLMIYYNNPVILRLRVFVCVWVSLIHNIHGSIVSVITIIFKLYTVRHRVRNSFVFFALFTSGWLPWRNVTVLVASSEWFLLYYINNFPFAFCLPSSKYKMVIFYMIIQLWNISFYINTI